MNEDTLLDHLKQVSRQFVVTMSMQTLTRDVDATAVAGYSDAYSLALATQARQKLR